MLLWNLKAVSQLYTLLIDGQDIRTVIFVYLGFNLDIEKGYIFFEQCISTKSAIEDYFLGGSLHILCISGDVQAHMLKSSFKPDFFDGIYRTTQQVFLVFIPSQWVERSRNLFAQHGSQLKMRNKCDAEHVQLSLSCIFSGWSFSSLSAHIQVSDHSINRCSWNIKGRMYSTVLYFCTIIYKTCCNVRSAFRLC